MSQKNDLRLLAKSAEGLAYALRETLDVIAEHEARIKRIEQKLGSLSVESSIVEKVIVEGRVE